MRPPNLGDRASGRAVFSLASLLLLMTLAAVVSAALRMGELYSVGEQDNAEALSAGAVFGLVFGAIIGLGMAATRREGIFGFFLSLSAGMGFGAVAALLIELPASMPVLAAGSVVLVAVAAVVRSFSSRQDPPEDQDKAP